METFSPGDRVVAINTDLTAPIRPDGDISLHPFRFPDGPLRRDVVYHVEAVHYLDGGHQGVHLTGMRVTWGNQDIPWHFSRFRKVDSLKGHTPKKHRRKQPVSSSHQSSMSHFVLSRRETLAQTDVPCPISS